MMEASIGCQSLIRMIYASEWLLQWQTAGAAARLRRCLTWALPAWWSGRSASVRAAARRPTGWVDRRAGRWMSIATGFCLGRVLVLQPACAVWRPSLPSGAWWPLPFRSGACCGQPASASKNIWLARLQATLPSGRHPDM